MPDEAHHSQRVALTKAQCATPDGQELVNLLLEVVRDGLVTAEGFRQLQRWLEGRSEAQLPAVAFLSRMTGEGASRGELTPGDIFELQFAIERVLPKELRDQVVANRRHAWSQTPATDNQIEYLRDLGGTPTIGMTKEEASALIEQLQPRPTEKQIAFIRDLGGTAPPNISRRQASELIDHLLAESEAKPTPRQIMLLRFWNRRDLANGPRHRIAEWLDGFYKEDPRRKLAWEMFKIEAGDDGSQHDPSSVPIGAGETYLDAAAQLRRAPAPEGGAALTLEETFAAIRAIIDGAGVSIEGEPGVLNELCQNPACFLSTVLAGLVVGEPSSHGTGEDLDRAGRILLEKLARLRPDQREYLVKVTAAVQPLCADGGMSIEQAIAAIPAPPEAEEQFCSCPCSGCGVNIEFPVHGIGETVSCPKCGSDVVLFDSSQGGQEVARD
jgi:hypothetical protein